MVKPHCSNFRIITAIFQCPIFLYLSCFTTKPTKWHVRQAKTQINLGIHPVWSKSSLSAWRKLGSLATHWMHSEDSDQTGRMPRLIWVFTGRTVILLVLSCGRSFYSNLLSLLGLRLVHLMSLMWSSLTLSGGRLAAASSRASRAWSAALMLVVM